MDEVEVAKRGPQRLFLANFGLNSGECEILSKLASVDGAQRSVEGKYLNPLGTCWV
ncbi:hypothetical protein RUM43_003174 [Polyplax serrata]|uniref:Uncharacterized protein n=1 Tax=Polyplax serrata TaxID=468196 RepID=A0AAN8PEZ3_POLSC